MNGLAGLGQPTNPPPELTPFPHPTLPSYAEGGGGEGVSFAIFGSRQLRYKSSLPPSATPLDSVAAEPGRVLTLSCSTRCGMYRSRPGGSIISRRALPPGPILLRERTTLRSRRGGPGDGWHRGSENGPTEHRFCRTEWEISTHRASMLPYVLAVAVDPGHRANVAKPTFP